MTSKNGWLSISSKAFTFSILDLNIASLDLAPFICAKYPFAVRSDFIRITCPGASLALSMILVTIACIIDTALNARSIYVLSRLSYGTQSPLEYCQGNCLG